MRTFGWNALTNRPKESAYRAPGAPQAIYAVESVIDELCQKLNLDPLEVRLKNAAKKGTLSSYGPTFDDIGLIAMDRNGLRARGLAARAFAERWHDPRRLAAQTLADYQAARVARTAGVRTGTL